MCVYMVERRCMCQGIFGEVRRTILRSQFSPPTFTSALEVELRSPRLWSKHLYPLNHQPQLLNPSAMGCVAVSLLTFLKKINKVFSANKSCMYKLIHTKPSMLHSKSTTEISDTSQGETYRWICMMKSGGRTLSEKRSTTKVTGVAGCCHAPVWTWFSQVKSETRIFIYKIFLFKHSKRSQGFSNNENFRWMWPKAH